VTSDLLSLPFFSLGGSLGSFGQILADRVEFILSVFQRRVKEQRKFCECLRAADHSAALFVFNAEELQTVNHRTIGTCPRNMLFLDNVGQNVRTILPKLWRHLPAPGADLQILQIQFSRRQDILSELARPAKAAPPRCRNHLGDCDGCRFNRDQRLELIFSQLHSRFSPGFLSHIGLHNNISLTITKY
jgi:hypothetical protein